MHRTRLSLYHLASNRWMGDIVAFGMLLTGANYLSERRE